MIIIIIVIIICPTIDTFYKNEIFDVSYTINVYFKLNLKTRFT